MGGVGGDGRGACCLFLCRLTDDVILMGGMGWGGMGCDEVRDKMGWSGIE